MTPPGRASMAALLAAGTFLIAGCGSSPLSAAQLRQRVTGICSRANRQLQAITPPQSESGAKAFLEKGGAALNRELAQLRALSATGDSGRVYQAAVRAVGGELVDINHTVQTLGPGTNTVAALRTLSQRLTPLETQADDAWSALQIPDCVAR